VPTWTGATGVWFDITPVWFDVTPAWFGVTPAWFDITPVWFGVTPAGFGTPAGWLDVGGMPDKGGWLFGFGAAELIKPKLKVSKIPQQI
jgi:hypothetical protein